MVRVAIIGASGYTGLESIEILLRHPEAQVSCLTALPEECGHVADIFGALRGRLDMHVEVLDMSKLAGKADVVLCCLPHKVSMSYVPRLLDTGLKVIDFSADYRLKDVVVYENFYQEHTDAEISPTPLSGCRSCFGTTSKMRGSSPIPAATLPGRRLRLHRS